MKISIKLIALVLALLTVVACVGCTPDTTPDTTTNGGTTSSADTTTGEDTSSETTTNGVTPPETTTGNPEDTEAEEVVNKPKDETTGAPVLIDLSINGEAMKNFTISTAVIGKTIANDLAAALNKICGSKPAVADSASDKCIKFVVDSSLQNQTKVTISAKSVTIAIPKDSDTHKMRGFEHFRSLVDFDIAVDLKDTTDTKTYTTLPYDEVTKANKVLLKGETDKDPLSYKVGETVTFKVYYMNGSEKVDCPKILYTIQRDDGKSESGWAPCVDGVAIIKARINRPGAIRVSTKATTASSTDIAGVTAFSGGAFAAAKDISTVVSAPEDFDDFWYAAIDELFTIDPEVISMDVVEETATYKVYNVKIKAVDDSAMYKDNQRHDYVSGLLTVPVTNRTKAFNIRLSFQGYGVTKPNVERNAGSITFNVLSHAIDANGSASYYSSLANGDLKNYGFYNNDNRNTVYFKNMILRDLQALRWVTSYFGEGGEGGNLWNGVRVTISGASQGGFQAIATTALAPSIGVTQVTELTADVPWMCDLGRTKADRINSYFLPSYTTALRYYDSVYFAQRITSGKVSVKVGLIDQTSRPTGIIALYNELGVANKNLTYIQNGDHDYWAYPDRTTSFIIIGDIK